MRGRFEIKDREHPKDRGMRFSTLALARRELARAVPQSRFYIVDRVTGQEAIDLNS